MFLPPPSNHSPSSYDDIDFGPEGSFVKTLLLAVISIAVMSLIVGTSLYLILDIVTKSAGTSWSFSWYDCLIIGFHAYVIKAMFRIMFMK